MRFNIDGFGWFQCRQFLSSHCLRACEQLLRHFDCLSEHMATRDTDERKNIILRCDFRAGPNSVGMPGADDLSSVIYNNTYRALAQYPEFMSRIGISDILQPLKIFQLIGGFVDV